MKGKVLYVRTEEHKKQCRERSIGKKASDATKEKMRKSHMKELNPRWSDKPQLFCKYCGKEIDPEKIKPTWIKKGWNQYCSNECRHKEHGQKIAGEKHPKYVEKIKCICQKCGKEFEIKPSAYKNGRGKFCSRACSAKGLVTKICEVCGNEYKVKPSNAAMRRCCSSTCRHILKSRDISGPNNPAWDGGISKDPYCNLWNPNFRTRAREFFGNICVECGKLVDPPRKNMHVHHVLYDKGICCEGEDVGERLFVTLCKSCHTRSNHNKEHWKKYYTDMINTRFGGKCYYTHEEYDNILLKRNKIIN
jgi:ribosomal protein L31